MQLNFNAATWPFDTLLQRARGGENDPADGDAARQLYEHFAERLCENEPLTVTEKEALVHALRRLATYYASEPDTVTPVTAFMSNERRPVAARGAKAVTRVPEMKRVVQRVEALMDEHPKMKKTTAMRQVAQEDMKEAGEQPRSDEEKSKLFAKYLQRVKRWYKDYEDARRPE